MKESFIGTGGPKSTSKIKEKIYNEYIKVSKIVQIPIRKLGSASLDLANVACGRFDGFWQRELSYWDIAAGILIIQEAGGTINDFRNYNYDSIDIRAASNIIYPKMMEKLTNF